MTDIDLNHLLHLAALDMPATERSLATADLERIIEMIDRMQRVTTDGVLPMANPLDRTQRLRPDAVTEQVNRTVFQQGNEHVHDGYYIVPRVVD
ncbi:MAG: Asp-tRNA(Asn)/Glu-tRNA(Gln) amidotransferase subunit GatC [Pseudomonadales bacterium]|nr:Asp-tRNA(Asn)/Glu-tRNA(Gln) amidotransferase subunit GatC [Pseudomonadales bacterium]MCP5185400.1 Asp-tRNA(Asn)/Glu-tRNA(Gln) amidotransferase subunit GatC [Pseudomonadales bacterium]